MKRIFSFSILMAIMTIALLSCEKNNGSDPNNPDNPAVVMQDVALSGTVKDTNGNPLSGVKVTTGSLNATTGSDGTFSFKQAGTVDERIIMMLEKSGYFTLTRSCEKDSSLYVEAMLYPQGNSDISLQTTFVASSAKTLQVGGMKIDFPASSILSADGKAYSGTVHADVLYLAPDNANFAEMMAGGDLICLAADNSKKMLMPLGMANVVLTDNSGNPLNLKDKSGVEITFPAPATGAELPATVPFWTFDETKGVLVEDGSVTLQGNSYTGAVNHFSIKFLGEGYEYFYQPIHVSACQSPAVGAWVSGHIQGKNWKDEYFLPNIVTFINNQGNGKVILPVADGFTAFLWCYYNGYENLETVNLTDGWYAGELDYTFNGDCEIEVEAFTCGEPQAGVKVWILDSKKSEVFSGVTGEGGFIFTNQTWNDQDIEIYAQYNGETKSVVLYASTSDNSKNKVEFDFDCNAITFNLLPGPNSNSVIIQCQFNTPKSPFDPSGITPNTFMISGDINIYQGLYFNQTGGNEIGRNGIFIDMEKSGWNTEYTEYTETFYKDGGKTWIGDVSLAKIDSAVVARLGPSLGITSIKIGSNNPVSFAF